MNVTFLLGHVGACADRNLFSGWSPDWIHRAMGYPLRLDRFYTPADARSAYSAVKDLQGEVRITQTAVVEGLQSL